MSESLKKQASIEQVKELQMENERLKNELNRLKTIQAKGIRERADYLQALNLVAYSLKPDGSANYYLGAVAAISGYEEEDFLSGDLSWTSLIHPEDLSCYRESRSFVMHKLEAEIHQYRIVSGQGQIKWLNDMAVPILDEHGRLLSIEGLILDISIQKSTELDLMERQMQLDSILNSVQDVIWSVTPDNFELLYISPSAENVYGYSLPQIYEDAHNGYQLLKTSHSILVENFNTLLQQGWFEVEYPMVLPNGEKHWLTRRAHFANDAHGYIARIDGTDIDITRRKLAEESLRYISVHDPLTGVLNRFAFEQEMREIDNSAGYDIGLIVCDVDGLKTINDNLGHEAGDHLLKACAEVLKDCFDQGEIVSRIGGDEFTILIKDCRNDSLEDSVKGLSVAIEQYNQAPPQYPISLSIGHAYKSSPDKTMSEVFREADNLMYAKKPEQKRTFQKLYRTLGK
ncbi:MAG: diguanylate cyclase domain-containing protein [Deltaproteobacteria bacterium]